MAKEKLKTIKIFESDWKKIKKEKEKTGRDIPHIVKDNLENLENLDKKNKV